ncbi:MAG: hypothetical protein QOH12_1928 [Solirubrobacteraceae bacterium]|jgi:hypothetical protein|nr:hypothetical protein [Solirubrobacteraceae bacterium]
MLGVRSDSENEVGSVGRLGSLAIRSLVARSAAAGSAAAASTVAGPASAASTVAGSAAVESTVAGPASAASTVAGWAVAGAVVAAGLVSGSPALAAEPWSAPQTIALGSAQLPGPSLPPPSSLGASSHELLALPGGGIAFATNTNLNFIPNPTGKPTIVAPVGLTGLISTDGVLGPLAPIGAGRTASVLLRAGPEAITAFGTVGLRSTLTAASGRPGHTLRGSRSLSITGGLVVGTTDDAVLVNRCTGACVNRDLVVVRHRGNGWSVPRAVDRPGTERGGAIATLADGTIAVAYERNQSIYVRRLSPTGRLFPAQRVGPGVQSTIRIAAAGRRRLAIAWAWQRVSEGDAVSGFTAQVACSTGLGHFSGRSHVLASIPVMGTGRYVSGPGIALEQDVNGQLTLAWSDFADGRFVVTASNLTTTCATARQTVAVPGADAVLGDLAVAPSGRATIALTAGIYGSDPAPANRSEAAHGILAVERPAATAPFSGPVQVSAADDNEAEPVVAIDQTNGRSVLAWRNTTGSTDFATSP